MNLRFRKALVATAMAGALIGGGSAVAFAQTDIPSTTSTTTPAANAPATTAPSTTAPAAGSNANCPNM